MWTGSCSLTGGCRIERSDVTRTQPRWTVDWSSSEAHQVHHWRNTKPSVAVSSGEAEMNAF